MKNTDDARLLQQLVPANNGGSSGIPGGAQRPVPANTGDLRERIAEAKERLWRARVDLRAAEFAETDSEIALEKLQREYEATRTPVGGNDQALRSTPAQPN